MYRPRSVPSRALPHVRGAAAPGAAERGSSGAGRQGGRTRRPRVQHRRPLTGELVRLQPGLGVQPADDEVVGEAAGCRGAAAAAAHASGRGARRAQRERGRAAPGARPGSPAAPAASMAARGGRRRAAFWERPSPLSGGRPGRAPQRRACALRIGMTSCWCWLSRGCLRGGRGGRSRLCPGGAAERALLAPRAQNRGVAQAGRHQRAVWSELPLQSTWHTILS